MKFALVRILSAGFLVFSLPVFANTREVVLEMSKDSTVTADELAQGVLSYRTQKVPGIPLLDESPYVGFVVEEELVKGEGCKTDDCAWKAQYQSQYKAQYQQHVFKDSYEDWFDMLMSAEAAGELPAALSQVSEIGSCLAKKVEATSESAGCKLDNSDALPASTPSVVDLAWMKYTCVASFVTKPCDARQKIFNYAKPFLIQARKPILDASGKVKYINLMDEYFPQIFPRVFRAQITGAVDRIQGSIQDFVSAKFGTTAFAPLWKQAPLVDLQDTENRQTGIQEFAQGLSADIRAAAALARTRPEIAAPLFYAAANRVLVLMGGEQLAWDSSGHFKLEDGDSFDDAHPDAAPKYQTTPFGGIGMTNSSSGPVMRSWKDAILNGYNPSDTTSPSPLVLIPSQFILGEGNLPSFISGQAPYETMEDLGALMTALVDFLEFTSPSSSLASHFIDTDKDPDATTKLIGTDSAALFPRQGRLLAFGLFAAIVQDMISASGHIVVPGLNAPDNSNPAQDIHSGVLGIRYYDVIDLTRRIESKVPMTSLSSVFGAAARFGKLAASGDPDVPPALVQLKPKIDAAVDLTMLSIMARSQQADGGFVQWLGDQAASDRNLDDQISAISTLTTVYDQQHESAHRLALKLAWGFLDHFWTSDEKAPVSVVTGMGALSAAAVALSLSEKWKVLNLWNQTLSSSLYTDLMDPAKDQTWGKAGWDKWRARFEALRNDLLSQLPR